MGNLEKLSSSLADSISYFPHKEEQGLISKSEIPHLQFLLTDYVRVSKQIETKWAQNARIQWLRNGGNNTKFFFTEVKIRRKRNQINTVQSKEGTPISDHILIINEAILFFKNLWTSQSVISLDGCPPLNSCISNNENDTHCYPLQKRDKENSLVTS